MHLDVKIRPSNKFWARHLGELIHEGRNRSHFAWQRAVQFDAMAVVIVRYHRHSEIILKV
jgi:hypothetical protein